MRSYRERLKSLLLPGIIAVAFTFIALGCGDREDEGGAQEGTLKVVATTGMIADAARTIIGDRGNVTGLMGPGVDPHLYKATQSDLRLLTDADLVLYNGLHLEGKMADVLGKLASRKDVIAVADVISPDLLRSPPEFDGYHDPHVWFDVGLWRNVVAGMVDTLIAIDPEGAELYRKNGDAYLAKLDALHTWVGAEISTIPQNSRVLITAHDAFGYFGRAYDIEVRGLQGISTVSEFGISDRSALVDLIVNRNVKAVFIESSIPRRNIEALVESVKAKGQAIEIGGELFSDAMGKDGTPEGTYIGMVESNVNTIVRALK